MYDTEKLMLVMVVTVTIIINLREQQENVESWVIPVTPLPCRDQNRVLPIVGPSNEIGRDHLLVCPSPRCQGSREMEGR